MRQMIVTVILWLWCVALATIGLPGSLYRITICVTAGIVWMWGRRGWAITTRCIATIVYGSVLFFWHRMPMYAVPPQRGELTILTGEVSGYRGKSMVLVSDQYGEWLVQQPSSIEDAFIPPSSSSLLRAGDIVRVRGYMDDERYYHQGSLGSLPMVSAGGVGGSLWYQDVMHRLAFDYPRWRQLQGYAGTIYASDIAHDYHRPTGWGRTRARLRQRLGSLYGIEDSDEARERGGLLMGMLIGDTSMQSAAMRDTFRASGLAHITAVSGGNIALLLVVLGWVLWRLPVYIRYGVMACVMVAYGAICGRDSSVTRAVLMGGIGILAIYAGRVAVTWRTMLIVMLLMLVRRPYALLYDAGFQLSFVAVTGILLAQHVIPIAPIPNKQQPSRRRRGARCWSMAREMLVPLVGATRGVFPVLVLVFGSIGVMTMIANLLVAPVISLIMIGGLVSLVFPQLSWGISFVLDYVLRVAERAGSFVLLETQTVWGSTGLVVLRCVGTGMVRYIWYRYALSTDDSIDGESDRDNNTQRVSTVDELVST